MPYSSEGGKKERGDERAGRYKIVLTEKDKRRLFAGAAVILVLLAGLTILLGSIHRPPVKACDSILLSQNKFQCLDNLAFSTSNASICASLPGQYGYACAERIAESTGNVNTCANISNSYYHDSCVSNVSLAEGNAVYCNLISNSASRNACIYGVAEAESFNSVSYCNSLAGSNYSGLCNAQHYYNSALSSGNASYCNLIQNSTNSSILSAISSSKKISNYSSLNISEELYFGLINATPRGYCYYKVALSSRNASLCQYASGMLGTVCAYSFYAARNNTANYTNLNESYLCGKVPSYLQSYCTAGVQTAKAVITDNVSICLSLGAVAEQASCIKTLAARYNESSYCSYISNSTARSVCYLSVTNSTPSAK